MRKRLFGHWVNLLLPREKAGCSGGKRRARRTETAAQGDAGVSGTAVHRGHGV